MATRAATTLIRIAGKMAPKTDTEFLVPSRSGALRIKSLPQFFDIKM
ncbi:hypothetical protein MUTS16_49450 [Escherichia coli]|nr:hypothetical protein MUTS16_49450 [Escherichia coli]